MSNKYTKMTIKELKKKLNLTNKEIAEFFEMSQPTFQNSSAKSRYENALVKFYEFINKESCD